MRAVALFAALLFSWGARAESLGRLDWGPRSVEQLRAAVKEPGKSELSVQLRNLIAQARGSLGRDLAVVAKIEREGVLETDPRHRASDQAIHDLAILDEWALCSRVAVPELAGKCGAAARRSLLKWAQTYQPTGNPIDEANLLPAIVAADLVLGSFDVPSEKGAVVQWLWNLIATGDRFFAAKSPKNHTRVNNHTTWRLAIRSLAAQVLEDPGLISANRELVSKQADANLAPPADWKPDPSCPNNFAEKRYGGRDFRERDALHYHVYDLEAWAWIAEYAPDLVRAKRPLILQGLEFLKPYYEGAATHIEFACSKVPFDIKRRASGLSEFQNRPWKPERARPLLRRVLPLFPEIQSWAGSAEGQEYSPWIKTIAAMRAR